MNILILSSAALIYFMNFPRKYFTKSFKNVRKEKGHKP